MAKQVGRYQIQQRIGQGAMANVYRAYDPGIDRVIAIKVLKREYCRNAECAARFLQEAKAAGALSHPNIVTIYDVGEIEGFPYIAMELLEGQSLDKVQRDGPMAIADVLEIGRQLADALSYAHAEGVVHRDIKPSNIMVGRDGRSIKILDFGIARVAEADRTQQVQTQIGQVLGTPRYMSPEQALGRALDGRSDLFSVGVVLYELITGRPAFDGSSAATLALQITQKDPAPIETADCPRGLKFIVGKLLQKRPDKRFALGDKLRDALVREQQAYKAVLTEDRARHLPLQLRLMVLVSAITAVALSLSIGIVLARQQAGLERIAMASGASIAAFVASNAAPHALDNSVLPPEHRNWRAAQTFVDTASADPSISQMMIVDSGGIIRAASDQALVGARYLPPVGQHLTRDGADVSVTSTRASNGVESLRFAHPINYMGMDLGRVDVSVAKRELQAAADLSRTLLISLGVLTLGGVMLLSFAAARLVVQPIHRLKSALKDAADGDLDFRLSHQRADEFGDLFDAFNRLAAVTADRLDRARAAAAPPLLLQTPFGAANDAALYPVLQQGSRA